MRGITDGSMFTAYAYLAFQSKNRRKRHWKCLSIIRAQSKDGAFINLYDLFRGHSDQLFNYYRILVVSFNKLIVIKIFHKMQTFLQPPCVQLSEQGTTEPVVKLGMWLGW